MNWIYSSVFGDFETAWAPLNQPITPRPILITDRLRIDPRWDVRASSVQNLPTPQLANRAQKMLFFSRLPHPGRSVYLDGNVRAITDLTPIFNAFGESGADMALYPHYARSSVRAEAEACLQRNKVRYPDRVGAELDLYSNEGFPDNAGLWEGSVIFKNHQSPKLAAAMSEWWELYSRFENRDQFSLPFIIWKHGLTVLNLDTLSHGREHYFHRIQHSSDGLINRTARYLQARAPESSFWSSLHRTMRRVSGSQ